MSDFFQRFETAIEKAIGPKHSSLSDLEIIKTCGLSISRETLRGIRQKKRIPAIKSQEKILASLSGIRFESALSYVNETSAKDEVLAVLGSSVHTVQVNKNDVLPCDLVLKDAGLGFGHYIVRCLGDSTETAFVQRTYFDEAIENLSQAMGKIQARQAAIITHRQVPNESLMTANKLGISIVQYDEFVKTRIDGAEIEKALNDQRVRRNVSEEIFSSLPASQITKDEVRTVDSITSLKEFLTTSSGSAVASILGSFGSGKTSTLLSLAHDLVSGKMVPGDWAFPIWIHAGIIVRDNIDATLQAAFAQFSPKTPLPIDCIRRLISRGRLWVFVDALDESLALAKSRDIERLIKSLCELSLPLGRIIISARQEMFNSRIEELDLFETKAKQWGIANTLLLKMDSMPYEAVKSSLEKLVGATKAGALIRQIDANLYLQDLVKRPIFMYIASEGAISPQNQSKQNIASIFEAYVQKWSTRETGNERPSSLSAEDRLIACEILALTHQVLGKRTDGFSVDDLRDFAISDAIKELDVRNIDLFVYEARISMFLERNNDDRFDFAHASMREFFLARRAAREIVDAVSDDDQDIIPYRAKTLGRVLLTRWLPLARIFLVELLSAKLIDPVSVLRRILSRCVSWPGLRAKEHLQRTLWTETPPFGPGRYRHLIVNLSVLLKQAWQLTGSESNPEPIDLSGAYLAFADISQEQFCNSDDSTNLNRANLDGANFVFSKKIDGALYPANPCGFVDRGRVLEYCVQNQLLSASRFSSGLGIENEFVIFPGGEYQVQNTQDEDRDTLKKVRLSSFLIQRYPVTNGQFLNFLREYPEWEPDRIRRMTDNDYYLGYWPADPRSKLFSNPEWLNRPVVQINWNAAAAFAAASGMRLPTEVEWEVAARAGQKNVNDPRPWGPDLLYNGQRAIISLNEFERGDAFNSIRVPLHSVMSESSELPGFVAWKKSLDLDVPSHMIGLIKEWVLDVWSVDFPMRDPLTELDGPVNLGTKSFKEHLKPLGEIVANRVLRGGGYNSPPEQLTVTYRVGHRELNVNPDAGFRCVRLIYKH